MKIFVIGCGAVGTAAATLLSKEDDVNQVVVGDIDLSQAQESVEILKQVNPGVEFKAVAVNAADSDSAAMVTKGVDFVYNAASSACNLPLLKACIRIGANYMDTAAELPLPSVNENANIANSMALDHEARAAGILAVTCMGIGPGYTNVAVHHMVNQMDEARQVRIKWFDLLEAEELIGTWSPAGLMAEFLGGPYPVVWRDGKLSPGEFLYSERHDFPEPVGKRSVYTATFHPELWMLPHYLPDGKGKSIDHIDMMGGMDIGSFTMKDVWLKAIQKQAVKETFDRPLRSGPEMLAAFGSSFKTFSNYGEAVNNGIVTQEVNTVSIEVTGMKDDKRIRHTMYNTTVLDEAIQRSPLTSVVGFCTAQCGVTVALMGLRGEITQKGVITPDQLAAPEKILGRLDPDAFRIEEKIERRF
jgi:saccharopine dehydrogenase-like NADP-dependent oxidoreductase